MKYLKVLFSFLFLFFFSLGSLSVQAEEGSLLNMDESLILYLDSPNTYVNGVLTQIDPDNADVTPVKKDGHTLVPVDFISEEMGAEIIWAEEGNSLAIKKENTLIQLNVGFAFMIVNGEIIDLDTAPQVIQGQTYVPLRATVESLQKKITWYDGLIVIDDEKYDIKPNQEQFEQMITTLSPQNEEQESVTNMINTNGPGTVLLQGEYVYYNDGFNRGGTLTKFQYDDETNREVLANEPTTDLNIENDWIYYIVPNGMGTFGSKNPIKKMKTDGTQRQTIIQDNQIVDLVVAGDSLYYTSYNYSDWKVTLYKAKTNGTNKQKLYEGYDDLADVADDMKSEPSHIQVVNDQIYLLIKKDCGYSKKCSNIYRMNTDGSQLEAINTEELAVSMQIVGDKVYYIRFPEEMMGDSSQSVSIELYTMDLNGQNKQKINSPFDEYYFYVMDDFKVHGDWIYFVSWDNIYKMKNDGTSLTHITKGFSIQGFDVVGEWIYYQTSTNSHRVKTDGTHYQMLFW